MDEAPRVAVVADERAAGAVAGEIHLALAPSEPVPTLIPGEPSWVLKERSFQRVDLPATCRDVLNKPMVFARSQVPVFLSRDWPALNEGCELKANFKIEDFLLEPQAPRFLLHLAGGLARLEAQLQCAYGPRIMTIGVTCVGVAFTIE